MIPPGGNLVEIYRAVVGSSEFKEKGPEERIATVLSIRTPQDVRFLSQFIERDVKLHSFTKRSATTSAAVFRFRVERFYCNASDNLQGGAQSAIYDVLSSLTMQAIGTPGFWLNVGVSRSLSCTFLRPAPEGMVLLCEIEIVSAGKSLALLRGVTRREDTGAIISTMVHDKAAIGSIPGPQTLKL